MGENKSGIIGISGLLLWMAGLTLVPGILWVGWIMVPRENRKNN